MSTVHPRFCSKRVWALRLQVTCRMWSIIPTFSTSARMLTYNFVFAFDSRSNGCCVPRAFVSTAPPASEEANAPGGRGAVPHTASHFRRNKGEYSYCGVQHAVLCQVKLSRYCNAGDKGERLYSSYTFLASSLEGGE
jgi:hypothetical protein